MRIEYWHKKEMIDFARMERVRGRLQVLHKLIYRQMCIAWIPSSLTRGSYLKAREGHSGACAQSYKQDGWNVLETGWQTLRVRTLLWISILWEHILYFHDEFSFPTTLAIWLWLFWIMYCLPLLQIGIYSLVSHLIQAVHIQKAGRHGWKWTLFSPAQEIWWEE